MGTPSATKVIDLFQRLSAEDQLKVLTALSASNPQSLSTEEYMKRHQAFYGESAYWSATSKSGPDHAPTINITLHTSHGDYVGVGSNQKFAKLDAVKQALVDLKD